MKRTASLCAGLLSLPAIALALNFGIKKEHVGKVHSLAIISVYSNAEVRKLDNRAGGVVGTIGFLKKMKEKKADPAAGHFGGTELVQHALDAFAAELGKVKGWSVKDPRAVASSPDYKAFVEDYKKDVGPRMVQALETNQTAAPGMAAYQFQNNKDKKMLGEMADLCAKLGVDSVAIVELDVAQRSTFATAGVAGKVWPSVSSTLKVVTKAANVAVAAIGPAQEPAAPVEMTMDNMADTPAARAAFKEAIDKSAAEFRDTLNKNIP